MHRMLFPALVLSGPAMAHTDTHLHAHGADYATLGVGLALIAVVAITLLWMLPK
ncbi:hypothetical protein [uncultured Ruegeria sp.]|jgi:hypothetical protein|uniref:hypothetical protein n=1 Tax=uncultured Ruegeria sp. TaxID=259304 RepID=UPI00260CC2C3|nr:hypothetical protein [uncultured Ruegeria sp.]